MSWIGVQGCVTSLHYDRCHGFLVQIRGKKRVCCRVLKLLVSWCIQLHEFVMHESVSSLVLSAQLAPLNTGHLPYVLQVHLFSPKPPRPSTRTSSCFNEEVTSRVSLSDLRDPSAARRPSGKFPLLASAQPRVTDLNAGEILYIPPGHWHEVETLENSISVTIPWDLRPEEQPPRHMYT